jgi:hypothetical protein
MSFHVIHKFEYNGKTYKFVPDEDHETRGSYGYDGYVIRCSTDSTLYWSNKDGWVDNLPSATPFTKAEHDAFNLPIGGEWITETTAAEDEEIAKLESGEWTVLGCIVEEPCSGLPYITEPSAHHCNCCSGSSETDSVWGIVIDNTIAAWEQYVKDGGI